jgi:hypothetical protein
MASIIDAPDRINTFFDPLIRYAQMLGHAAPAGWQAVHAMARTTQPVLVAFIGAEFIAPRAIELVGSALVSGMYEAPPTTPARADGMDGDVDGGGGIGGGSALAMAATPTGPPPFIFDGVEQRATLLADVEAAIEASPVGRWFYFCADVSNLCALFVSFDEHVTFTVSTIVHVYQHAVGRS